MSHLGTTQRGTGRTTRMLQALPIENTPTVVVHTQAMADYVRNLAQRVRPDLKHPIRVRIVTDTRDCEYLRGLRFVVDHATLEHASPRVRDLLRAMERPAQLRVESNP
jgi:hypothetical protein